MRGKFSLKDLKSILLIYALLIVLLVFAIGYIVYLRGGTAFVLTHLIYIPIIIAAYIFDIKGAVATAFLGGMVLGPWMPVHISEGILQEPSSWIFRTVFLILFGVIIGFLFQRIKREREILINKSYINEITGLPNTTKLKIDLKEKIDKQESFSMMVFRLMNIDRINRYIDYSVGEKSILKAIEILANLVGKDNLYSIFVNEFAVIMPQASIEETYIKANKFIDCFKEPILIDGVPVNLIIKGGISNYPLHGVDSETLFKKMGIALDQEENDEYKIAIYEDCIAQKNKTKYETVLSLYDAIKNDEFTIVYQPIVDLRKNEINSVEALLRWNNSKGLNPDEFIKIAEDANIISRITKWVITNVVNQLKEWQEDGIKIKVAINISSRDLKNDSIIAYAIDYMKNSQIEPTFLEFELTERVIIENQKQVGYLLDCIKDTGMKISLDDFGTGYNSLVQLVKMPIDYLKIDKLFIDNIQDTHYRFLIKELIELAHNLGQEVIAEGVETETQMEILNNMGCDNIQGYYFSKPLHPEKLKEYLQRFVFNCN